LIRKISITTIYKKLKVDTENVSDNENKSEIDKIEIE
jgi:hypothetical protein